MSIPGQDEKATFVIAQEDPAVRLALYRRLEKNLDLAEKALAHARADLAALALALEIGIGERLPPRRSPVRRA